MPSSVLTSRGQVLSADTAAATQTNDSPSPIKSAMPCLRIRRMFSLLVDAIFVSAGTRFAALRQLECHCQANRPTLHVASELVSQHEPGARHEDVVLARIEFQPYTK